MSKRDYIQANKDWLEAKAKEGGVMVLPKGIYYKVLSEGNQDSAVRSVGCSERWGIRWLVTSSTLSPLQK